MVVSAAVKKFSKMQKNPKTTAAHTLWEEAESWRLPEAITSQTLFALLKADDQQLEVRPLMEWHIVHLMNAMKERWMGKLTRSVDSVTCLCLVLILLGVTETVLRGPFAEPNFMLVMFGDVRDSNPAGMQQHQEAIKDMTSEEYKAKIKMLKLHVLGGRHTYTAMVRIAKEDEDFRMSGKFKYINPKYVYFFPRRNKHFLALAR